ncbi:MULTISPECIES: hypothetical protein [Burkholderiaceae]|jgi:hypothetical protein|uniref:hypothetical protein n=1 Tax=Burkholderiaceae TaxID=119060 RepID=UPI000D068565|nr:MULTISPECIES: hypothetical protein [Burkholderiaceae]MBU9366362.1 hypothetical protein [Burkholderia multivorans]PRZ43829.1 hypothetical protein BX589_1499 [Paraburkholderia fungorum]
MKQTIQCSNCGRYLVIKDYLVDLPLPDINAERLHYSGSNALDGRAVQCPCGHYIVSERLRPRG